MQNMSRPQDQGTLCSKADIGDRSILLHCHVDFDIDVFISVAERGHAASNARTETRFVNGKHSATKHPGPQSANIRIWNSVVRTSMNSWTVCELCLSPTA